MSLLFLWWIGIWKGKQANKPYYLCKISKRRQKKAVKEIYPLLLFEKKLHVSTFIIVPSLAWNPKTTITTTATII